MVSVRFNDFFYCSSVSTLGIRIAHWGGLLSGSGLYKIYILIKNFSCFFWVFFKDSVFFESNAIISYDSSISEKGFGCILKWSATLLLLFDNKNFQHIWSCCCICFFFVFFFFVCFFFFIFMSKEVFPRRPLEVKVFRFRSFHNLFT